VTCDSNAVFKVTNPGIPALRFFSRAQDVTSRSQDVLSRHPVLFSFGKSSSQCAFYLSPGFLENDHRGLHPGTDGSPLKLPARRLLLAAQ